MIIDKPRSRLLASPARRVGCPLAFTLRPFAVPSPSNAPLRDSFSPRTARRSCNSLPFHTIRRYRPPPARPRVRSREKGEQQKVERRACMLKSWRLVHRLPTAASPFPPLNRPRILLYSSLFTLHPSLFSVPRPSPALLLNWILSAPAGAFPYPSIHKPIVAKKSYFRRQGSGQPSPAPSAFTLLFTLHFTLLRTPPRSPAPLLNFLLSLRQRVAPFGTFWHLSEPF